MSGISMTGAAFFTRGIGIVPPHRAQQAAIVRHLDTFMPSRASRASIFSAVETAERFQDVV